MAATGAICLFYFATILLGLFGVDVPLVFSSSPYGIGFSLFVVGLAAFNLLLDFDFIEKVRALRGTQVHGMVRRLRLDGHA